MRYQPKHAANDSKSSCKKLIAKLLVVCMIIGLVPVASLMAFAAEGSGTYTVSIDVIGSGKVEMAYSVGEDTQGTCGSVSGDNEAGTYTISGDVDVTKFEFTFTPDEGWSLESATYKIGDDTNANAQEFKLVSSVGTIDKTAFDDQTGEIKISVSAVFVKSSGPHYWGGGSAGASTTVRSQSTAHGTFDVSDRYARPGQTVTVTPRPDSGYMVGDVVVRDRDGNLIPVTDNGDGTYSFVMPESKYIPVTVSVTFVPDNTVGGFIDVTTDDYFADAVQWAVEHGITAGTSANTFSPNAGCTRGMIVTFLWKAYGSPEPATTVNPFIDVPASEYFCKPVLWAVENGITAGTSANTFSPNDTCTRGQAMTFLYKAAKSPAAGTANAFVDVPAGAYYAQPVAWAVNNGITAGTSATTFSPDATCTRGQIVTFLYKALG